MVYADFACILQDIETCQPNPVPFSTTTLQEHMPYAFAYYVKYCYDSSLDKFRMYKGPDFPQKFINSLVYDLKLGRHYGFASTIDWRTKVSTEFSRFDRHETGSYIVKYVKTVF